MPDYVLHNTEQNYFCSLIIRVASTETGWKNNTSQGQNGSEAFNLSKPPDCCPSVCHLSEAPVSTMPYNNCLISYCAEQAQCSQQTFPQYWCLGVEDGVKNMSPGL